MFVSEVKHFHCDKLVSFRFGEGRLDFYLFKELDMKKEC